MIFSNTDIQELHECYKYILMLKCIAILPLFITNSFEVAWNSDKEQTAKLVVNWNGKIASNTMMSQSNCFPY